MCFARLLPHSARPSLLARVLTHSGERDGNVQCFPISWDCKTWVLVVFVLLFLNLKYLEYVSINVLFFYLNIGLDKFEGDDFLRRLYFFFT